MFRQEDLEGIWVKFGSLIDRKMPKRAAHCPYCFGNLFATFDTFGRIVLFCECIDWVMLEQEFKLENPGMFPDEPGMDKNE